MFSLQAPLSVSAATWRQTSTSVPSLVVCRPPRSASTSTHALGKRAASSNQATNHRGQHSQTTATTTLQQQQELPAPAPVPVPLRYVVREAVKRWHKDAEQDALRGDVKQQALLAQMLFEGYGCDKDPVAAQEWADKSWARGYRMSGVYCEL